MSKKFKIAISIVAAVFLVIPSRALAGASKTASFKMSLTIPAIVGLNVPIQESLTGAGEIMETRLDLVKSEEIINRNGVDTLVQTMVVK